MTLDGSGDRAMGTGPQPFYVRACRAVGRTHSTGRSRPDRKDHKNRQGGDVDGDIAIARRRWVTAREELDIASVEGGGEKGVQRLIKKEREARSRFEDVLAGDPDRKLTDAIRAAGMPVEPFQVKRLAGVVSLAVTLAVIAWSLLLLGPWLGDVDGDGMGDRVQDISPITVITINDEGGGADGLPVVESTVTGFRGTVSPLKMMFLIMLPLICLPLVSWSWVMSVPVVRARREERAVLASMPEAVGLMTMSMSLDQSLERAVDFTAANGDPQVKRRFRKVQWDVTTRRFGSLEESFKKLNGDVEEQDPSTGRSLSLLLTASREPSRKRNRDCLERSMETVTTGMKHRMEQGLRDLSTPSMVLLSLGVILPISMAALLPMSNMGGESLWAVILVLDVLVPLVTLGYTMHVLNNRPAFGGTGQWGNGSVPRGLIYQGAVLGTALAVLGLVTWKVLEPWPVVRALPFIWAIGAPLALVSKRKWNMAAPSREDSRNLEEDLPDSLQLIGERLQDGASLEKALEDASMSRKDTPLSRLLGKTIQRMRLTGSTPREAMFGRNGTMGKCPSSRVKAAMGTVLDASVKDPESSATVLKDMAAHMGKLARVEKESWLRLGNIMATMENTAKLFGPLILGVTLGLFIMLSGTGGLMTASTAGSGGGDAGVAVSVFPLAVALGIYLISLVVVIAYFTSGARWGRDRDRFFQSLGRIMPPALVVFSLSAVAIPEFIL